MEADNSYIDIIKPIEFVKNFKTKRLFIEWCMLGTVEDLKATRTAFEKDELYKHLIIIQEVIDYKNNL
jgi:hypothetical protein